MADYGSNSNKVREVELVPVERKVDSVVSGPTTTKKQNGFSKFASSIIVEDVGSVGSYILSDVLLPAFKKAIAEVVTNGIDMLLYGKTGVTKSSSGPKVSYGSYYTGNSSYVKYSTEPQKTVVSNENAFNFDNIIFSNRGDAEAVLEEMRNMLDTFQVVRVGDLYDLANIDTANYMINKYGWTNLSGAQVARYPNGGYILKLPKATLI